MSAKLRLIFLPGLGADHRLLEPQRPIDAEIEVLRWIPPLLNESFSDYARRLANTIDHSRPFVLGGISLGGMFAQEIAQYANPHGLILLSTCRSNAELPRPYRLIGLSTHVLPVFAVNFAKRFMSLLRRKFGIVSNEQAILLEQMLADTDPRFIRWAVHELLRWRGPNHQDVPILHIHGTHDRVIPPPGTQPTHLVPGAGHIMNITHADQVNRIIDAWLASEIAGRGCAETQISST